MYAIMEGKETYCRTTVTANVSITWLSVVFSLLFERYLHKLFLVQQPLRRLDVT